MLGWEVLEFSTGYQREGDIANKAPKEAQEQVRRCLVEKHSRQKEQEV